MGNSYAKCRDGDLAATVMGIGDEWSRLDQAKIMHCAMGWSEIKWYGEG